EDPIVLERFIRGFDFPRSDADDQNPVCLRHEFGGRWVCRFYLFGRLLKHGRQFRVPAVRAGQRPALTRNDPLNICVNQREKLLFVVGTYCCKESLHNLHILFCAHKNFSNSTGRSITIHQSNLTRSLKISRPQLFPRACTSNPPSESAPSFIGANPRFSASAPISPA